MNKTLKQIVIFCLTLSLFLSPNKSTALTQESANLISNTAGITASLIGCSGLLKSTQSDPIGSAIGKSVPTTDPKADKRQDCYDKVAYNLASKLLDRITQATINWANTGFNKKGPFYVENQRSYLQGIQNDVIRQGASIASTDPVGKKFARQLLNATSNSLESNLRSTQNAADRRFSSGRSFSWTAWQRMILIDTNNPLGYAIKATNLINKEASTQVGIATQELLQGQGFKPFKKCINPTDYKEISESEKNTIKYQIQTLTEIVTSGGITKYSTEKYDASGNVVTDANGVPQMEEKYRGYSDNEIKQAEEQLKKLRKDLDRSTCKQWDTQTPGSFIAHKLEKGSDVQTDKLLFINKASQSLGIVIDAALNGVMKWGLKSLSTDQSSYLNNLSQNALIQTNQIFQPQAEEQLQKIGTRFYYDKNGKIIGKDPGVLAEQAEALENLKKITENENGNWALLDQITYWSNMADFCIPGPMPDRITELGEKLSGKVESYNNQFNSWWGQIVTAIDVLGVTDALKSNNQTDTAKRYTLYTDYIKTYYEVDGAQYTPTTINGSTNTSGVKLYANMPDLKKIIYPIIRQQPDREQEKTDIRNTITKVESSVAQLKTICISAKEVYTKKDQNGDPVYPSKNTIWKNIECI